MRARWIHGLVGWAILIGPTPVCSQGPAAKETPKAPKPIPDELEEMVKELRKAYEPLVDRQDSILKEIRKAYFASSAAQEEKVMKDIRKAYLPTAEQETAILEEIRKAYGAPSAAQEEKIIQEIQKAAALPLGRVIPDSVAVRAEGMFRRLDQNGDGLIHFDELPEQLRRERAKWDGNSDGFIDLSEYKAYFLARTQLVQEERAGLLPENGPPRPPAAAAGEARAGNLPNPLPAWFKQVDADGDGQIGLYEWRMSGRALEEFQRMDRNDDGFLTVAEALYFLSSRNPNGVAVASTPDSRPTGPDFGRSGGGRSFGPSTNGKGPPPAMGPRR